MKKGITILGNMMVDAVKNIDAYPQKGLLAKIKSVTKAVGGSVPNTLIDIAVIDKSVPLYAMGGIGNDEYGRFCVNEMKGYGINTEKVKILDTPTGFSDIMTSLDTGERTIFTTSGAGDAYSFDDAKDDIPDTDIFHAAYISLMEALDSYDEEYGTMLARLLARVQSKGIKTSIDAVSSGKSLSEKVIPALRYCDYVIMNEIECCDSCLLDARNEKGELIEENLYKAMRTFIDKGVKEKVVIHCPEYGFVCNKDKTIIKRPSVNIPKGWKVGSVGAGDAFCAGTLYALYNSFDDEHLLDFASGAAICNLTKPDSISGMKSSSEIEELVECFGVEI